MQGFVDGIDHIAGSREHVGIPESQDAQTFRSQIGVATRIVCRLLDMLTPVELDDDTGTQAHEVADVRTNRVLPPELEVIQLSPTQMPPEVPFGIRRRPAQGTDKSDHLPS